MLSPDLFFIIFLLTILVVRVFLYFRPTPSPTVGDFRLHHYMYGIALLIVGYVLTSRIISAIGFGLFVDELTYLLIGGKTHADNYSIKSLLGTVIFIVVAWIFRGEIVYYL